jgi:hypothetical protein
MLYSRTAKFPDLTPKCLYLPSDVSARAQKAAFPVFNKRSKGDVDGNHGKASFFEGRTGKLRRHHKDIDPQMVCSSAVEGFEEDLLK